MQHYIHTCKRLNGMQDFIVLDLVPETPNETDLLSLPPSQLHEYFVVRFNATHLLDCNGYTFTIVATRTMPLRGLNSTLEYQ